MPFRSLGPQKRDFSEKTIEDFRLGAISPRQGRPYPGEIPGDGLPALPGTYRPQAFSGKQIIEKIDSFSRKSPFWGLGQQNYINGN